MPYSTPAAFSLPLIAIRLTFCRAAGESWPYQPAPFTRSGVASPGLAVLPARTRDSPQYVASVFAVTADGDVAQ